MDEGNYYYFNPIGTWPNYSNFHFKTLSFPYNMKSDNDRLVELFTKTLRYKIGLSMEHEDTFIDLGKDCINAFKSNFYRKELLRIEKSRDYKMVEFKKQVFKYLESIVENTVAVFKALTEYDEIVYFLKYAFEMLPLSKIRLTTSFHEFSDFVPGKEENHRDSSLISSRVYARGPKEIIETKDFFDEYDFDNDPVYNPFGYSKIEIIDEKKYGVIIINISNAESFNWDYYLHDTPQFSDLYHQTMSYFIFLEEYMNRNPKVEFFQILNQLIFSKINSILEITLSHQFAHIFANHIMKKTSEGYFEEEEAQFLTSVFLNDIFSSIGIELLSYSQLTSLQNSPLLHLFTKLTGPFTKSDVKNNVYSNKFNDTIRYIKGLPPFEEKEDNYLE
jgi:hypothetical protein